jgi:lipopolysaccharide export system permease protein
MPLLSRFLLQHFLRILLLCSSAFITIYLLIDFFEKIEDFIEHQAGTGDYLSYLLNSIPFIFVQILPLAVLTTMVLTLGGLSRTNEVTAMRACGVSLWRVVRPLMGLAVVLSFTLLLLNEMVVPWNSKQLNLLLEVKLKGKQPLQLNRHEIWYRDNDRIINIKLAAPKSQTLKGVSIFTLSPEQKIIRRQDTPLARYQKQKWQADELAVRTFDPQSGDLLKREERERQTVTINMRPQDFVAREDINSELNFRQLSRMARQMEQQGFDASHQRVDMHNRLAAPFTCLVMAFLGVPFALQRGRKSNIALGIGLSLSIGIGYFIIQSLVTSFGYAGALPPVFAAWTANFIFLLLGVWLLLNVRE